jgi:hypothetical protein
MHNTQPRHCYPRQFHLQFDDREYSRLVNQPVAFTLAKNYLRITGMYLVLIIYCIILYRVNLPVYGHLIYFHDSL